MAELWRNIVEAGGKVADPTPKEGQTRMQAIRAKYPQAPTWGIIRTSEPDDFGFALPVVLGTIGLAALAVSLNEGGEIVTANIRGQQASELLAALGIQPILAGIIAQAINEEAGI